MKRLSKYKPTVYVMPRAYQLMSLWARLGGDKNREMTCFGRTEIESGNIYITDAYMVAHEADSGGVDADDADINKLMYELDQKGIPPDQAFRCWVHSHPGRGDKATYLSGTDEAMIDRFMLGAFLVSIVFDSVGESPYCRIDFKTPRISIEADVEVYVPYLSAEEVKWARDIYKEKARSKPVVIGKYKGGSYASKLAPLKGEGRVIESHSMAGMGWDDEDVDWAAFDAAGVGADADADADPGTEMAVEVPEYEMTATEYAYFNVSMAGQVDGLAQQVLGSEVDVDDALDEMIKLGYSKSQAVEEMEFRLGSTVDVWRDDEEVARLRDEAQGEEAQEEYQEEEGQELLEFEAVPEPVQSDPPGFWSALTQGDGANDKRNIQ